MNFRSTRGTESVSLDDAILRGIAPDGGLYMPENLQKFGIEDFADARTIQDVAGIYLGPYFQDSYLATESDNIIGETYGFPIPVVELRSAAGYVGMLELHHGPTAAFKDVGAAFLAACISRLDGENDQPLTILVATSGDTGGAVAAAFDSRPGVRVVVLYPDGRVSKRQAHQLTCWSDNVLSLAVQGSFDDCQALVKSAFSDPKLAAAYRFSSANSINIGRLLPQSIYYADASLRHFRTHARELSFVVPTGNLGNALACILARESGLPIGKIVLATNANRMIADYLAGAPWEVRDTVPTLASAMDVGNPSNMERLRSLLGDAKSLNHIVSATAVTDSEIELSIRAVFEQQTMAICPHTATAMHVYQQFDESERQAHDWAIVSTAHPAKFESIVEPIVQQELPLPPALLQIMTRPSKFTHMRPTLPALQAQLDGFLSSDAK